MCFSLWSRIRFKKHGKSTSFESCVDWLIAAI